MWTVTRKIDDENTARSIQSQIRATIQRCRRDDGRIPNLPLLKNQELALSGCDGRMAVLSDSPRLENVGLWSIEASSSSWLLILKASGGRGSSVSWDSRNTVIPARREVVGTAILSVRSVVAFNQGLGRQEASGGTLLQGVMGGIC
jgi:hypothetical protein